MKPRENINEIILLIYIKPMSLKVATGLSQTKTDKIINFLMKSGKKSVAKRIYNDMLKEIKLS